MTGFPGFLATELMKRIVLQKPEARFLCLIQPKFQLLAEEQKARFPAGKVQFVLGDIVEEDLGIKTGVLDQPIDEIFHFAAVYDLNVAEAQAFKINVTGTENMIAFANKQSELKRFHYVSTCYVSGRHAGIFRETDLELGQSFNNFYESTKFEAEKRVRQAMVKGLKTTIYRPAVVVGNSQTGETQKFDGPYFIMQWLLRQPGLAILPRLCHPERYTLNIVPSDFVLDAMAYLSQSERSLGKTYHLADSQPLTIEKLISTLGKACERNVLSIPLPKALAKFAVGSIPGLERWLGIPRSSLDYFAHATNYSTDATQGDLAGSGIECPKFSTYAGVLVQFMKTHPELRSRALI
ncbi:MAG: SDR family oxidoreductase [Bdellovibrionales bacterium]|nr:SDR family oxidoreductase [Oligoflexia bacterium]